MIVRDRRVVLPGEDHFDERQVVETSIKFRQLLLCILPSDVAWIVVTGSDLELHDVASVSVFSVIFYYRSALARQTTSTCLAPARRSAVAHAVAVDPVV